MHIYIYTYRHIYIYICIYNYIYTHTHICICTCMRVFLSLKTSMYTHKCKYKYKYKHQHKHKFKCNRNIHANTDTKTNTNKHGNTNTDVNTCDYVHARHLDQPFLGITQELEHRSSKNQITKHVNTSNFIGSRIPTLVYTRVYIDIYTHICLCVCIWSRAPRPPHPPPNGLVSRLGSGVDWESASLLPRCTVGSGGVESVSSAPNHILWEKILF